MEKIELLTEKERIRLPLVIAHRNKYKRIIRTSINNVDNVFSNCMMVSGSAGSGKTYSTMEIINLLEDEEVINGSKRASGHITPRSLFHLLEETKDRDMFGRVKPLILDDVDCLRDEGCLELLKSAFDTKSNLPQNRQVFYMTEKEGKEGFKYNGFGIIITNDEFKNPNVHQQALLDRVQLLSIDLKKDDMYIYITHTIEDFLNKNEDNLSEEEIKSIVDLYNNEIRTWMQTDAFGKAKISLSNRLIKKFVDSQRLFGEDWKTFNTFYARLEAASEISTLNDTLNSSVVESASTEVKVSTTEPHRRGRKPLEGEPLKDANGRYLNPKTNTPFSEAYQYILRKKYSA